MKPFNFTAGALSVVLALSTLGAGCATKKFVRARVDPIDRRVGDAEKKSAAQGTAIESLEGDLSRTKEKLSDTDARARNAGDLATQANSAAGQANTAAQQASGAAANAQQTADSAKQGITVLEQSMQAANNFKILTSQNVLFAFGRADLGPEAKKTLDDFAKALDSLKRYALEVQGFTDRSGAKDYNVQLSQQRAENVARYLATEHSIPIRSIHLLGVGPEAPTAENKTSQGRMQSRRVELKLYVPEAEASKGNFFSAR